MKLSFFVLSVATLGALGCGTSSTAVPNDSGVGDGSSADGATDGSIQGAPDSGPIADSAVDAPADDSGPDCLAVGATTNSCRSCCASAYAAGSAIFDKFTVICACQPSLCGPPDAGAPVADAATDGGDADTGDAEADDAGDAGGDAAPGEDAGTNDGGLYGNNVCAATCEQKQQPSDICNTCLLSTLGSVTDFGPCGGPVVGQCLSDTECNAYFGCVQNCPP